MTGDDVEELATCFADNADDDEIEDARLEAAKWEAGT